MKCLRTCILILISLLLAGCAEKKTSVGMFPLDDHPLVDFYVPSEAESTYHYLLYTMYRLHGDDQKALEHFQMSIGASPSPSAELLMELSALYSLQHDQERAISVLEQAVALNPYDPNLYKLLSLYYYQEYDFLRARDAITRAIDLGQTSGEDFLFLADVLEKIGDYESMVQVLHQLTLEHTDNYVAHYSLGVAFYRQQRYDDAARSIRTAMEIRGGDTLSYRFMLGKLRLEQGYLDQALDIYEEIYRSSLPMDTQIATGYSMRIMETLHEYGHYDLSIKLAKRMLQDNPSWIWTVDYCTLGLYAMQTNAVPDECNGNISLPAGSGHAFTRLLFQYLDTSTPEDRAQILHLLNDSHSQGILVQSMRPFLDIDKRFGRSQGPKMLLELLQSLAESPREALAMGITIADMIDNTELQLTYAADLYEQYPDSVSALQLAWAHYDSGNLQQAVSIAEPYAKKKDAPAELLNFLGYIMVDHHMQITVGGNYIRRAVEQESNNPYYIDSLAWYYYRTRDYTNARIYIERSIMLLQERDPEPDDAIIFEHAGDILQRLGDQYRAFAYYARSYAFRDEPRVFNKMQAIRRSVDAQR
ncbi:tetratricopeptide repeat protein [Desulfurispirillum indicum]|uniref:tetratricopeptide repeat protein n=1 Tax=Desulfurispirillum indicum TaxID=936456 RepID=UPI001CFC2D28|nr:tetratricopeptide repeat protein [Desulfurispirillum indicum]UCZ55464.1 tetratricopeptide repeat protein [Desulfurispirillum indicum]